MQYTTTLNMAMVQSGYPTQWTTAHTASASGDEPPALPDSYRASSIANQAD